MSLCLADETSRRAYWAADTSLWYYAGGSNAAGALVASLEKEPNQVQEGDFQKDSVAVALWDMGLFCYGRSGLIWSNDDIVRIRSIVYSDVSRHYYVGPEEGSKTLVVDSFGKTVSTRKEMVLGTFSRGRFLLVCTPGINWRVISLENGSPIVKGRKDFENPVLGIAGNNDVIAVSLMGGSVQTYDLHTGRPIFTLKRQNWFSVASLISTRDPLRFRALLSSWDGEIGAAAVEIDVAKQNFSLLAKSKEWNWNSELLNHGESVLRFRDDHQNRFQVMNIKSIEPRMPTDPHD